MRVEVIEWIDHHGSNGSWVYKNDLAPFREPAKVVSVGAVLEENRTVVMLVGSWGDDDMYDHVQTILKCCITKRYTIRK